MIGLMQRVSSAQVTADERRIASIGAGLLVLVGVEKRDTESQAKRLAERLLGYRVFEDDQGRMNLSLTDIDAELLLVPQFTLPADTRKGTRPSFTPAADPETGRELFDCLVAAIAERWKNPATGDFGANMSVALVNEGPVTFWLQVTP